VHQPSSSRRHQPQDDGQDVLPETGVVRTPLLPVAREGHVEVRFDMTAKITLDRPPWATSARPRAVSVPPLILTAPAAHEACYYFLGATNKKKYTVRDTYR